MKIKVVKLGTRCNCTFDNSLSLSAFAIASHQITQLSHSKVQSRIRRRFAEAADCIGTLTRDLNHASRSD
jgi:hypothetical protein